jgi:hypothetical protein
MKATRKNLEALVSQKYYGTQHVNVFKGVSLPDCEKGWYVQPFGKNARFIGRNLSDAIAKIESELEL